MQKEQVIAWLKDVCQGKDWFHDINFDQYGRAVVYVKYMNAEVLRAVPDWTEDGKQVLCHFAASDPNIKKNLVNKSQEYTLVREHKETALTTSEVRELMRNAGPMVASSAIPGWAQRQAEKQLEQERELELSVRAITDELDRLERLCGANILGDIFFEEHDQGNAVTNLSAKYPEVRKRLHKLYELYGFYTIYEELILSR